MNAFAQSEAFVFISRVGGLLGGLAAPVVAFVFLQIWNDIQDLKRSMAQTNAMVMVSNAQRDDIIRRLGKVEDYYFETRTRVPR